MQSNKYVISTDDLVEIYPLYGKKSKRQLKFSEYMINLNQAVDHSRSMNLEGLSKKRLNYQLTLDHLGFRVKGDQDFLLNGTYSKDSLIQDGDRLEIDENILVLRN